MEPTEPSQSDDSEQDPESPEAHELSSVEKFSQELESINYVIEAMLMDSSTNPLLLEQAWLIRDDRIEEFANLRELTSDNPNFRLRFEFDILVDKAIIFENTGNLPRYLEELDDAEGYAKYWGLDQILVSLTEEIDERVGELGTSPEELVMKLRGHISFGKRHLLRESLREGISYEGFIRKAHDMILMEKGNPEEVFKQIGLTE